MHCSTMLDLTCVHRFDTGFRVLGLQRHSTRWRDNATKSVTYSQAPNADFNPAAVQPVQAGGCRRRRLGTPL